MDGTVTVFGASWCGDCLRTKRFLDRNGIAYSWVDTDSDSDARDYVQRIQDGRMSIPVVTLPDGRYLIEPADRELAEALGLAWPG